MKKLVAEDFGEYIKEELNPETEQEVEAIEDTEFTEDEVEINDNQGDIVQSLRNELTSPEFSRDPVEFRLRSTGEEIEAIPMAELSSGEAFLFKIEGRLKKIKLSDMIIIESKNTKKSKKLNEEEWGGMYPFGVYLSDIAEALKNYPEWQDLVEEGQDLVEFLEINADLWNLEDLFSLGISPEDVAQKIMNDIK